MTQTHFIVDDALYVNERACALRLAGPPAGRHGDRVRPFPMADAVGCATRGQTVHEGCHGIERVLGRVLCAGGVGLCGTWMDARGLRDAESSEGARRGALAQRADGAAGAGRMRVFQTKSGAVRDS